jgi:RHS repeat-associated protein
MGARTTIMNPKLLSAIFLAALAFAQVNPLETRPQRGFMPTAANLVSEFDTISPVNGNVSFSIPLASLPSGRGGHSFGVDLVYNSQIYDIMMGRRTSYVFSPARSVLTQELKASQSGGWHYNFENIRLDAEERQSPSENGSWNCNTDGVPAMRTFRMRIGTPDGSLHTLHLRGAGDEKGDAYNADGYYAYYPNGYRNYCASLSSHYSNNLTGRLTYYTSDGSFLKWEIDADGAPEWHQKNWTLYYPNGHRTVSRWVPVAAGFPDRGRELDLYDSDNNKVTVYRWCHDANCNDPYTYIADDVGRAITVEYTGTNPSFSGQDVITGLGYQGTNPVWTVNWTSMNVGFDGRVYACSDQGGSVTDCPLLEGTGTWVVSSISVPTTPNASSYVFGYSNDADSGYGELDLVQTPYGAQIHYRWSQEGQYKPLFAQLKNPVKTKTLVHDGVTEPSWQFAYANTQSTITNPDGGVTTNYFYNPDILSDWSRGLVWKTVEPDGDVIEKTWARNKAFGLSGVSTADPNNPFVQKELRTVANTNNAPVKTAITDYVYDKNGNLVTRSAYDWVSYGTTTGSGLLRQDVSQMYSWTPNSNDNSDSGNAYWRPHAVASQGRRLDSVLMKYSLDASGVQDSTVYEYDNPFLNGNITVEKHWDSQKNSSWPGTASGHSSLNCIIYSRSYDSYGNLASVSAPDVPTTYTYGSVGGYTGLYPTSISKGSGSEVRSQILTWDFNSGLLGVDYDNENGNSAVYSYDKLGRRTFENQAGLRYIYTTHDDNARKVRVHSDLRTAGDQKIQRVVSYDQLGRERMIRESDGVALGAGETDGIKTLFVHVMAAGGNYTIKSNPYREVTDETMGWTCTKTDVGGKVTHVSHFSGQTPPATCLTDTNRNSLKVTTHDADRTHYLECASQNRVRESYVDGLGRVRSVVEHQGFGPTYTANYSHDIFGNVKTVIQGSQTRTFTYSSMNRLISAYNPENGGYVNYTYHDFGGVNTKTDPRSVVTTHQYDALQRLRTKTYSDGTPTATYNYYLSGNSPQVGRLQSVQSSSAFRGFTYDTLGRTTASSQTIGGNGNVYQFGYTYLLNDAVASISYPSAIASPSTGRVVSYTHDDAGRITQVRDASTVFANIASSAYNPHGMPTAVSLGNGLWESYNFNSRNQAWRFRLGTTVGASNKSAVELTFPTVDNVGSIQYQTTFDGSNNRVQSYTYDGLGRLTGFTEGGINRGYGYDQYGNRWVTTNSGLTFSENHEVFSQSAYNAANNRLVGLAYDNAGNLQAFSPFQANYDAENRIKELTSGANGNAQYVYDGDGRRVKKTWTPNGGSAQETYYIYDGAGRLMAEYSTAANPDSGLRYYFQDHLGNTRAITDASQGIKRYDYEPFGRSLTAGDNSRGGEFQSTALLSNSLNLFTGKMRDAESGLDFFLARYYSSGQGRFVSPDGPMDDQNPEDPQSWNRYAYARNNPISQTDDDGNIVATVTGAITGGLIGGTVEYMRGGTFWKGAAAGAVSGAVAGSIIDTGGASLGLLALSGAASGVVGGAVRRGIDGQGTTVGQAVSDGAVGAVAGVVGGKVGEAVVNKVAGMVVQRAANKAPQTIGPGSGNVWGTRVHGEMANVLKQSTAAKVLNLKPEVSYKGGAVARYGSAGSSRADVIRGSQSRPGAVWDLKTGKAGLTQGRINQIRKELPNRKPWWSSDDVQFFEVRQQ